MNVGIVNDVYHFSTSDVAEGLRAGLTKVGCSVSYFDPSDQFRLLAALCEKMNVKASSEMNSKFASSSYSSVLNEMVSADVEFVIFVRGTHVPVQVVRNCRKLGMLTGVYLTDEPYEHDLAERFVGEYDFVFSVEKNDYFGLKNYHHVPVAFDPTASPDVGKVPRSVDVCFVGTFFEERVELLDQIEDSLTGLNVLLAGTWAADGREGFTKSTAQIGIVSHEDVLSAYRRSRIGLNVHRISGWLHNRKEFPATHLNPRTFELAGSGCFQLVDDSREDLRRFFGNDEVVSFAGTKHLRKMINKYVGSDREREEIAERARDKVLANHTYAKRAEDVLNAIEGGKRK